MAYEKQTWRNGDPTTPLSAERLNHLEEGVHEVSTRTLANVSGLEALSTALDFGAPGGLSVGVVADSTMNDGNEAARILNRLYGARLPDKVRRVYNAWSGGAWSETVDHPGIPTDAAGGVVLDDTFSRTGEVVGTSPDIGPAWEGQTGVWSMDAGLLSAISSGYAQTTVGTGPNLTLTTDLSLDTTALAYSQLTRVYAAGGGALSGVWFALSINTSGAVTLGVYVTTGGTTDTLIATQPLNTLGVVSKQASPQTLTVEMTIDIQNLTVTATGPTSSGTWTATIPEARYSALGNRVSLQSLSNPAPGIRYDRMVIEQPVSGGTVTESAMWNGAIAGARFTTFDEAKITEMFGGKHIDVLLLSVGHNNGTQKGGEFVAEAQAWVDLWRSAHPETRGVVWVSQNPQFSPAANPEPHLQRQAAVRLAKSDIGVEYVPAAEAFLARPDGGASLVKEDGIHPTTPPAGVNEGDFGTVLTAEAIMQAITERI